MTIQEQIQEMIDTLNTTMLDAGKFDNGVKAAGPRVRKAMQAVKVQANVVRERVLLIKNAE